MPVAADRLVLPTPPLPLNRRMRIWQEGKLSGNGAPVFLSGLPAETQSSIGASLRRPLQAQYPRTKKPPEQHPWFPVCLSGPDGILPIAPPIEEGGGLRQFLLQVLHLTRALGSCLSGFVALFLRASQQCLQRFDRGASSLLRLSVPLRL